MWLYSFRPGPGMCCVAAACLAVFIFLVNQGGTLFLVELRSNRSNFAEDMVHIRDNGGIPYCASGVFLTLHKLDDEDGSKNESTCNGMLIRDDIILTTSECSNSHFTFNFPGVGSLKAIPHNRLNKERGGKVPLDSRLGFLKANPPFHYHFLGQPPVRRLRMFLSQNNNQSTGKNHSRTSVATHRYEGQKLIVHSFPLNGELVPLGHLKHILPKNILWEETDSDDSTTYFMIQNNTDRWWTRTISLQQEENTMQTMFKEYEGPPGSVSIPGAQSSFKAKAANFLEVVDPRGGHRRGAGCYGTYFRRWRGEEPFSGQHFFDWLDYGPGKHYFETLPKRPYCIYESFARRSVHYFDDMERLEHEIHISPSDDGTELLARYRINDQPVPESGLESGGHLYIWDLNKTLYIVDDTWDEACFGIVKHSGVMAGQPALSGGEAYFGKNGSIWGINFASGHYHPSVEAVSMMYQWMKDDMGWNATALHWIGREGKDGKKDWSTKSCDKIDWDSNRIPGYNKTKALNQSCHEVMSGPTWILMNYEK